MATYPKEQELISHYNSNPKYYSSPSSIIFDRAGTNVTGATILDLGCGDGRTCFMLLQRGAKFVSGVDYSKTRIAAANTKAAVEGLAERSLFCCDNIHDYLDLMIETDTTVDIVCMFEVLEHLENPAAVLEKAAKISTVLCGSVPINHVYHAHLQVFEHIDDIVKLIGDDALFTVTEGHVFFYKTLQK